MTAPAGLTQRVSAPSAPGGELRQVTVLFADLAGFTAFAEERAPDDVARVVGDLLQELGLVVDQQGGCVDKFLGDAVMATFGFPRADASPAHHAVRAGLAMQEALKEFCHERGAEFQLRIGIHAGEVMFRPIAGSYTIMGDTVNTASRIQAVATPGKVWISQPIFDDVRRYFTIAPRPAIELRGKRHSVQLFEVASERATPQSESPPFVGREREWAQLEQAIRDARDRRTISVVVVRGVAGVGKSRLVSELRDWLQHQEDLYRLDVTQYDHSERLPSHGLNALIRRRFDLAIGLNEQALLARLSAELPREDPFVEEGRRQLAAEFFAFVLGITRPEFRSHSIDERGKWRAAFVEVKQWMEGWASQDPWIWILEDAQKGDADTAAFLDWALSVVWTAPVVVVATFREEDFGPDSPWFEPLQRWRAGHQIMEVHLRELPCDVLATSIAAIGERKVSSDLARRIAEHTEGNPLFAIELMNLLKERNLITDQRGWEKLELPSTIREVMEARIERLGSVGKEVAKRGALMGRRFTREAVSRIWDLASVDLDRGLAALRESETIYEEESRVVLGEMEAVFRHGRLQEAALAMIPRRERVRWRAILEGWARAKLASMGASWEGAGPLLLPIIARSLEDQGEDWNASLWFEVLGLLLRKHHHGREAVSALSQALSRARGTRSLVLRRIIAEEEQFAGDAERALRIIVESDESRAPQEGEVPADVRDKLAALAGDPLECWNGLSAFEAAIALQLRRADILGRLGRVSDARSLYQSLAKALEGRERENRRLWMQWARDWTLHLSELANDPREAGQVCELVRARIDLRDPAIEDLRLSFLEAEGYVQSRLGHFDRAEECADEALRTSEARGNLRAQREAWNHRAIVNAARGELQTAAVCIERALSVSQAIGDRQGEAISLHNIGLLRCNLGDWDAARSYQERYMALSRTIGNRQADAYGPIYLGALAMTMGSYDEAHELLARARSIAEEMGWPRLVALSRAFAAETFVLQWLRSPEEGLLAAAIADLEGSEDGWSYFDDAGELYACLALARFLTGDQSGTHEVIRRARERTHESWIVHRMWLDLIEAIVSGTSTDEPLAWFSSRGYVHPVAFTERIRRVM